MPTANESIPNDDKPTTPRLKVHISRMVATPGAARAVAKVGVPMSALIRRHLAGDWGELCDSEDAAANDQAVVHGSRTLGVYRCGDDKVWVIADAALSMDEAVETEGHRFEPGERYALTVLLPSDY